MFMLMLYTVGCQAKAIATVMMMMMMMTMMMVVMPMSVPYRSDTMGDYLRCLQTPNVAIQAQV